MKFTVTERLVTGKKVKHLRRENVIPGVVYGRHVGSSIFLSFAKNEFLKVYHAVGKSMPLDLVSADGKINQMVLIHTIQTDPVTDMVLHVDFLGINKGEKVTAEVTLRFIGSSVVEKLKLGNIQHLKDVVEIEALPKDLPKEIEVDISKIETVQDVLFVKDIVLPKGVSLKEDPEQPVVTVALLDDMIEEEPVVAATPEASATTATPVTTDSKKK